MQLDHVTLAVSDLSVLDDMFTNARLPTQYGGVHSNGVTHMSILTLADGSYVELISKVNEGTVAPSWNEHMDRNAGPCAWAVEVANLDAETTRLTEAGVEVKPRRQLRRDRPDGTVVEWALATVGQQEPGGLHPFLIQDHTPRAYRVPTPTVGSRLGLLAVKAVVIGVADVSCAAASLRSAWGLPAPVSTRCDGFPAALEVFPGSPVALVPAVQGTWIGDRASVFGACPCAFLIECDKWQTLASEGSLDRPGFFGDQSLAWLPAGKTLDPRVGFVDAS